jgi:alkylation response protein AidB-like acyl-CoA dehydrogenase
VFDLGLSPQLVQLLDSVRSMLTRECPPDVVRASEASGFSAPLWGRCRELGLDELALPGGGGSLLDLAHVAELIGEFLAPVPLLDSVPAARLAAALGAAPGVPEGAVLTLAPRPPVEDVLTAVPSGAVADHVLYLDGDAVRLTTDPVPPAAPNLGGFAVADRCCAGSRLLADGGLSWSTDAQPDQSRDRIGLNVDSARARARTGAGEPEGAYATAVAEWKALLAAWLVGAGRRALRLGVDYAGEREAFGVKVGSFQAVAHRLADVATELDAARLLAWEAAWAFGARDARAAEAPAYASMALIQAAEAANRATRESLHVFGGYGFMLEYDIQLYFRRVKAAGLLVGDMSREPEHLADLLWGA